MNYAGEPNINRRVLTGGSYKERCENGSRDWSDALWRAMNQRRRLLHEAGQDKEVNSPLEFPEGAQFC